MLERVPVRARTFQTTGRALAMSLVLKQKVLERLKEIPHRGNLIQDIHALSPGDHVHRINVSLACAAKSRLREQ